MKFLKKRELISHKGDYGRVLVIGGSEDFVGAPYLAAMACLRSGADLVVVAAPEKVAWTINSFSPDLITKKFDGDFFNWDNVKDIIELAEKFDVVLIGNGLGQEPSTFDFVKEVVERTSTPMIIDADAIKALKDADFDNCILTPHETEFQLLTGEALPSDVKAKADVIQMFAKHKKIFLLKGNTDIIVDNKHRRFNTTGNPGMTIAGTGDILAGLTAGFVAQSMDLFDSAYHAAYINGKIGDFLFKKKGIGFVASDFLPLIPEFVNKLRA